MADYAKKGKPRAPAKRKNGKGKQPQAGRPRLWLMLAIVIIAIAGFSYFLFYIDGKAEQAPAVVVAAVVTPTKQPTDALPQVPKKKWTYIDDLQDKEVIVDVPEQQVSDQQYRLQCGSYRTVAQANTLRAKIAFQGHEAELRTSGSWQQVIIGPFDTRRAAESVRHKMQRARINGCKIYYWLG